MKTLILIMVLATACHHTVQASVPRLSDGTVVDGIQVRGNQAIATPAIVARIQTKPGDRINTAAIKRDIANVRSLGFEDVRVEEGEGTGGGKIITFDVRERPPQ